MQTVNIPGLDKPVNFPDSMSHEQIANAIETEILPRISTLGYAKTIGNAVVKGATGVADSFANLPSNLVNLGKMAAGTAATAAGYPQYAADVSPPPSPFEKAARWAGLIDPSREPINTPGRVLDFAGAVLGAGGRNPIGYGKNVAERAPLAFSKNLAVDTGIGLLGGGGQEIGERVAGTPGAIAGGILGTAVPGALSTWRNTSSANLAQALKGVSQSDLTAAQALLDRSRLPGSSPLTGPEAINQTAGTIPSLQTMQRVAEQSSGGSPILAPFMNARPGANAGLFAQTMAPLGGVLDPRMTATNMQKAAQDAITAQRQAGNTQARPFYDASVNSNARIPADAFDALRSNPAIEYALNQVKNDPLSGLSKTVEPPGSMRWLDAARKKLDDLAQNAKDAGRNNEAINATLASKAINDALDKASPQYAIARYLTGSNMQHNVAPMESGPLGKIANIAGDRTNASAAQFDAMVKGDVTPTIIQNAVFKIKDPNAAREAVVSGLQHEFDKATARLASGEAQGGGAKFAAIVDNPNVRAYITALPNGQQAYQGFKNMLNIFEAQGTRAAPGSMTAGNLQAQKEMTGIGPGVIADPAKYLPALRDVYDNWRFGKNTTEMAKLFTDKKAVDKMRQLAMYDPGSPRAAYLVSELINREAQ